MYESMMRPPRQTAIIDASARAAGRDTHASPPRRRPPRRTPATHTLGLLALLTSVLLLVTALPAQADRDFHTTQYPLFSVADGSEHGWVIDIHTQGVRVYAQERYLLRDVEPGETYVMNLYVHSDPQCTDLVVPVPGIATLTANASGNARSSARFVPEAVEGLPRTTYYLRWQVTDASGAVVHQTACVAVALD